eukprot:scaffold15119_cov63-Cyclotella_meneghiniana.AAC.7
MTSTFGHDRIQLYSEFFSGCLNAYKDKGYLCHQNEEQRLKLNRMQPPQMSNYTLVGFKKTKVSERVWKMIQDYWSGQVKRVDGRIPWGLHNESWPEVGSIKDAVYEEVLSHLKAWIPQASSFTRSNVYGIRVYTSGSILATHVDRDPLVSSAIINVDQSVTEAWPLEAYDHSGKAHNLTLNPGEMILYESHSVLHGRPFALEGEYYANIFVHFKPVFRTDEISDISKDEL